jgi:hypothetical protein
MEEEVRLLAYARHGAPDQPAVVRVLVEPADLRRRAQDLAGSSEPDPAELHDLGERLENHIRHAERVLFPMIEEALPMKELEQVAAAVECVDARRE